MRAITSIALLALLLIGSCSATIKNAAPAPTSPWRIVEDWNVTLPGPGMQIFPTYTNVEGIYIATTSTGIVTAINTTERAIQWQAQFDDIAFVSALPATKNIFVARYSGTTVLDAFTGTQIWFSSNITMSPNLAEDYNALVFDTTIVYRDQSNGFVRLCACDGKTGMKLWCDNRRTLGSPDAAYNNTFTAQFFDVNGSAYIANMNAKDGKENWFAWVDRIFTGSQKYVAVLNAGAITIVDSMTGLAASTYDVSNIANIGNSVFVKEDIFAFTDGTFWVAAIDCRSGTLLWNTTAPNANILRRVEMQHRGEDILVVASLSFTHTNFTRLNAYNGAAEWTASARPTGMSLAPVHAWLNNDILYTRNSDNTWSAWGADSGLLIAHGAGDLFLPRSAMASFTRPHFSFYVTSADGQMIDLRIERK